MNTTITRPNTIGVPFLAQMWAGEKKLSEVVDLSYDAAREIARTAPMTGHIGRIMSQKIGVDWCEVYSTDGVRCGPFAEVTLVRVASSADHYPLDWPKCPACGLPALDGHITCGKLQCDEGGRR